MSEPTEASKKVPQSGPSEFVRPNFPKDAFAGTAADYVRYRVPYPEDLLRRLVERSGVTGEGHLLDLACGPGRVALALAPSFREVWAIDLEPEMIEAGKREAGRRAVPGIKWIVGRAEDLEAPPDSFELIAIGEAFHRLDQQLIAARALRWLKPGFGLATLGSYSILSGKERWQQTVVDVVNRWTKRRSMSSECAEPKLPGSSPEHFERVLREAGFADVSSCTLSEPHDWTIETIIGFLHSTSVCSKAVLGKSAEAFESELKAALLGQDPSGTYRENTQWGYTLGRKPR
jgi:ubiquinone/menaquinone biosynthesis C-methylase UbiE